MTDNDDVLVYLVDDDAGQRRSLALLLEAHGYPVEAFASAAAFLAGLDANRRACLLLDLRLPGMDGAELQRRLAADGRDLPIVMLTAHGDIPAAVRAIKAGAVDFIQKPAREEQLLAAIAEARTAALSNRPRRTVPREVVAERLARLTAREREVLDHLVLGRLNKEIADSLGISQRTVEIHRARIREKMEARGLSDLILMLG